MVQDLMIQLYMIKKIQLLAAILWLSVIKYPKQ